MIPLIERLATLDSGTVYNIYALWFDRPQTGGKAACITALVPVLEDTERIFARTRTWDEDLRRALALTRACGVGRYADLHAACSAGGLADAETLLRRLFERGLPLPAEQQIGTRVDSRSLAEQWDRQVGIVPAVQHVADLPNATLRPKPLNPDRLITMRLADPSVLAASVVRIAALCGRRSLRLNNDELPGAAVVAALRKELGAGTLFALQVALGAGVLRAERGALVAVESVGPGGLEAMVEPGPVHPAPI